jgi:hypothetical protein
MTFGEQVQALRELGYSAKQAPFLVDAATFSGCFLRRQFSEDYGKPADSLCRKVLALHHAALTVFPPRRHVYYLRSQPFYTAIGLPRNSNRDLKNTHLAIWRLMMFDYVLLNRAASWLRTLEDRYEYFCAGRHIPRAYIPRLDKAPVRLNPDGSVTFAYIEAGEFRQISFGRWLRNYYSLIRALGKAEVVYVTTNPDQFRAADRAFNRVFPTANLPEEVLRYCRGREGIESGRITDPRNSLLPEYTKAAAHLATPTELDHYYRQWNRDDALTLSLVTLPHDYAFFGSHATVAA